MTRQGCDILSNLYRQNDFEVVFWGKKKICFQQKTSEDARNQ